MKSKNYLKSLYANNLNSIDVLVDATIQDEKIKKALKQKIRELIILRLEIEKTKS